MNVVALRHRKDRRGSIIAIQDGVFLAGTVWLSLVLYAGGLGLYSDDWGFLSSMHGVEHPTFVNLLEALRAELSTRPIQAVVLAGLYRCFGLDPLGYHLFNGAVLSGIPVLFYLALREIKLPRLLSVSIPLVFVLLPHYSTDRLWIAAFQANVSVVFYLFALYACLLAVRFRGAARLICLAAAVAAILGTVFAYEVVAPLFLLSISIVFYRTWQLRAAEPPIRPTWKIPMQIGGLHLFVLILSVGYKLTTTDRAGGLGGIGTYLWNIKRTIRGAVSTSYGSYGIGLPQKVARILFEYADAAMLVVGGLLGVLVFAYLYVAVGPTLPKDYDRRRWLILAGIGLTAFGLGYAISLVTFDIGFSATGINNRTAIAAAIGVAVSFVAGIGWTTSFLSSRRIRHGFFCVLIAAVCAGGFLIINTIADFWVSAAQQQEGVIGSLRRKQIQPGSVVLLDGFCAYDGPGVVFETSWDVSGMLQIMFDPSLVGDVVKPNTEVLESGIRTLLYDDVIHRYPFGDDLLLYHVKRRQMHRLSTLVDARRYFYDQRYPIEPPCPSGREGRGAPIF